MYANGKWSCTCDFFQERETCSHTMAAKQILTSMPLMGTFNEEIHIDDSN
ncbi:MAG TPA: SWIM zinc finger family protein [Methylomirabilota bacterium]|nr:SWIM zinc finger family protein [Methylomirabilota bacterium]